MLCKDGVNGVVQLLTILKLLLLISESVNSPSNAIALTLVVVEEIFGTVH